MCVREGERDRERKKEKEKRERDWATSDIEALNSY